MTFKAKIVCDGPCWHETELDTEDPYSVDIEINNFIKQKEWLVDEDSDSHYCPACAPEAAEELGIEWEVNHDNH